MDRLLLIGLSVAGWCLLAVPSPRAFADQPRYQGARQIRRTSSHQVRADKAATAKAEKLASQQATEQAVLERLIGRLLVTDAATRATSARALGAKGLASHSAIEPLAGCLQDDRDFVRVAAEWAIARIAQGVTTNPAKLTISEQQQCLRQFRIASEALGQQASSTECRVRLTAASSKLASLLSVDQQLAIDFSKTFGTVRTLPAHSVTSRSPTPDQLQAQLQRAIQADSRVEICQAVMALNRLGPAGLKPLVKVLEGTEEYSSVQALLIDFVSSQGVEVAAHLRPWLQIQPGALSSQENPHRTLALRVAQSLGPRSSSLLAEIIELLRSETDVLELRNLVLTLQGMGEQAAAATPDLLAVLNHSQDSLLSHDLLTALQTIAPRDERVLEAATALARDGAQSLDLRLAAAELVLKLRPATPEWTPLLLNWLSLCQPAIPARSEQPATERIDSWRRDSFLAQTVRLLRQGTQKADLVVPNLIPLLEHADGDVRRGAAESLATFGPAAAPALTAFLRMVRNESSTETWQAACRAIRALGPAAIERLIAGLHSFDEATRDGTYRAIAELGSAAAGAHDDLVKRAAQAEDNGERAAAIRCLGKLEIASSSDIEKLVAWTADESEPLGLRCASAAALGELGTCSAGGTRQLVAMLSDESEPEPLRIAIAESLSRLGSEHANCLLSYLARSEQDAPALAAAAACGLTRLGNHEAAVLRCLLRDFEQEDLSERARTALSNLPAESIATLEQIAADRNTNPDIRERAIVTLGQFEADGVPALVRLLSEDEVASQSAAAVLENMSWSILPSLFDLISGNLGTSNSAVGTEARRRAESVVASLFISGRGDGGPSAGSVAAELSAAGEATQGGSASAQPAPTARPTIGMGARAAGASSPATTRWETVKVFFGTNRESLNGHQQRRFTEFTGFIPALVTLLLTATFIVVLTLFRRGRWVLGVAASGLILAIIFSIPATRRAFNLERAARTRPGPVYGPRNADRIELGACEVTIPATHSVGHLEAPQFLSLEFQQDPSKHIVVQSVTTHTHDSFQAELREKMNERGASLLVFIHGYNVDFDDAARRTAQMAYDLKFPGAPLFFSWPSQGNWHQYRADERQVESSISLVKEFLVDLARTSGAKSIHLIAHSMGTRALSGALGEIQRQFPDRQPMFHQVVLAAPDIDAKIFRQQIAPRMIGPAERITLYASSNDLALKASRTFNPGGARAGDSHDPVLAQGIETIDVSEIDTSLLGHSYYGSNPTVLTDLRELLATERPAEQRPGLETVRASDLSYWMFRDRKTARGRNWSVLR